MAGSDNRDPYEILQVSPNAESEVIEAAYKQLARKYHPDVYRGPDANARMQDINWARSILTDPEKRQRFDRDKRLAAARRQPRPSSPTTRTHPASPTPPQSQSTYEQPWQRYARQNRAQTPPAAGGSGRSDTERTGPAGPRTSQQTYRSDSWAGGARPGTPPRARAEPQHDDTTRDPLRGTAPPRREWPTRERPGNYRRRDPHQPGGPTRSQPYSSSPTGGVGSRPASGDTGRWRTDTAANDVPPPTQERPARPRYRWDAETETRPRPQASRTRYSSPDSERGPSPASDFAATSARAADRARAGVERLRTTFAERVAAARTPRGPLTSTPRPERPALSLDYLAWLTGPENRPVLVAVGVGAVVFVMLLVFLFSGAFGGGSDSDNRAAPPAAPETTATRIPADTVQVPYGGVMVRGRWNPIWGEEYRAATEAAAYASGHAVTVQLGGYVFIDVVNPPQGYYCPPSVTGGNATPTPPTTLDGCTPIALTPYLSGLRD